MMRSIQLFLSDLKELLARREFVSVRAALRMISPVDLADGWEHFTPEERKVLFKLSPRQRAIQLFEELDPPQQQELLAALKQEEVRELVEDLDPSETGRILRELPQPLVRQLETILRKGGRGEKVRDYLKYPDESVGALMRSNFMTVEPRWTCRQALDRISHATRLRHIQTTFLEQLFVVEADGRLNGVVTLKELVVAPSNMLVKDLMDPQPVRLSPEMDQEEAARLFAHYRLGSAPVVDGEGKLLGVVLDQDIVEVVEEETEEDFAKMAGTAAEEFEARSSWEAAWHRMPWLAVTFLGQFLVSAVIRGFEGTLSKIVALATFLPMIAAMGGNVGSQSAIVAVRELAGRDVERLSLRRAFLRDLRTGAMLGVAYSAALVVVSHLFYGARFGWEFSWVVGLGTLTSMTIAAALGALVPLAFHRVGVDPATATGPLVTTLTDLISTSSYLAFAAYLLF